MDLTDFNVIKIAYRARLIFNTEAEYESLLGVKFDAINEAYEKGNEQKLYSYYMFLDNECKQRTGLSLRLMVSSYLFASEAMDDFQWGACKDFRVRKKFCRWLFLKYYIKNVSLGSDLEETLGVYNYEGEFQRLFELFYPDGLDKGGELDTLYIILMTFDIVKPRSFHNESENTRARDILPNAVGKSLLKMRELLETLKNDAPYIGVSGKPISFDESIGEIDEKLKNINNENVVSECTIIWLWDILDVIVTDCVISLSPSEYNDSHVIPSFYRMRGIWIDDNDRGKNRFWIIPDNMHMAFCYKKEGPKWVLIPYEFTSYMSEIEEELEDFCVFATVEGNEEILSHPEHFIESSDEIAILNYEKDNYDADGFFTEIRFKSKSGRIPTWMNWSSFIRLDYDDPLYNEFKETIERIYNKFTVEYNQFENTGKFMTDAVNNLIAIDSKYLYIFDYRCPEYKMFYDNELNIFEYLPRQEDFFDHLSLTEIEISSEHPIYLIPRFIENKRHVNKSQKKFIEAVANTQMGDQVSIYHLKRNKYATICFNKFSASFDLNPILTDIKQFGIKLLTTREALFKI